MKSTKSTDIIIIDETEACPYLEGKTARMPLRVPSTRITPLEADRRFAEGHRRTGEFIYQTQCPDCEACEPIRLNCLEFQFSRNQRRIMKKGNQQLCMAIGPLQSDPQRIELFNQHRRLRDLARNESDIDLEEYTWGFVRSCFASFEIAYWIDDRLVGLAICDEGANSLSAVYSYYDPTLQSFSLGTYSILKQIEYCQSHQRKYLYLGYYVADCRPMRYKSRFVPNERLIGGKWIRFESKWGVQPETSY